MTTLGRELIGTGQLSVLNNDHKLKVTPHYDIKA